MPVSIIPTNASRKHHLHTYKNKKKHSQDRHGKVHTPSNETDRQIIYLLKQIQRMDSRQTNGALLPVSIRAIQTIKLRCYRGCLVATCTSNIQTRAYLTTREMIQYQKSVK